MVLGLLSLAVHLVKNAFEGYGFGDHKPL